MCRRTRSVVVVMVTVMLGVQPRAARGAPAHYQVMHQMPQPPRRPPQHQLLQPVSSLPSRSEAPVLVMLPTGEAEGAGGAGGAANAPRADAGRIDDQLDSVIIEAEPNGAEAETRKAVLLLPNYGRLSIGGIISAIPFLPIEVNVPDTIGWAYDGISSGISSIISIVGRPPATATSAEAALQRLRAGPRNTFTPVVIIPMSPQVVPIRLPIQV